MQTILTINAGSTSLKCSLFELVGGQTRRVLSTSRVTASAGPDAHAASLRDVLTQFRDEDEIDRLVAIGHRVVHGGDLYDKPVTVDAAVLSALRNLELLAPLHQPINLELIDVCRGELPGVTNVACFDTAFHQSIPAVARNYALPGEMTASGLRAYGFHGLSYAYIWSVLCERYVNAASKRVVICHLGGGASLCAIREGRCVATTMGFSTAEGIPMATRSGSLDPGLLIHLVREHGMSADDLERLVYRESGLLGVSGISGDMRELRESKDQKAKEAIDLFVYRIVCSIGSLAAAMQGVDTLVFTGGIGTNDPETRDAVTDRLAWLGGDLEVLAIPTDEEAMIAEYTAALLSATQN